MGAGNEILMISQWWLHSSLVRLCPIQSIISVIKEIGVKTKILTHKKAYSNVKQAN